MVSDGRITIDIEAALTELENRLPPCPRFMLDNILDARAKPTPSIYQLKITLLEIEPPIWRRIQVPSTMPLCCLHDAIQAVMGWTDSHLHQFDKDGKPLGRSSK
jgi:hypothetical protein